MCSDWSEIIRNDIFQGVGKPALFSCPEGGGHLYPVSSAFLEAVKANTRKYYWTGRITTTAGTVYEFDQNDMVKGSGYITSQCCGSTEIELGTVYAAEMARMKEMEAARKEQEQLAGEKGKKNKLSQKMFRII